MTTNGESKELATTGGAAVAAAPDVTMQIMPNPYAGIASAPFTSEQRAILGRKLTDDEIEVRPDDGVLYLPGVRCRERLNEAFGIGGWGLAEKCAPVVNGTQVFAPMRLYILGRFVSEATGEGKWISNNPKSTYGTAMEGAKTDALGRCCKDCGIGLQLWDPKFTREWRAKNVIKVKNPDPARFGRAPEVWVRRDDPAINKDSKRDATNADDSTPVAQSEGQRTAAKVAPTGGPATDEQALTVGQLRQEVGGLTDDLYRRSIAVYRKADGKRCETISDLSSDQAEHYIERLKSRIHKQGMRVDARTDSAAADAAEVVERNEGVDPLDSAEPPPLPHAKPQARTTAPRNISDELQRVFKRDADETAWLHGLFEVTTAKELTAVQEATALRLLAHHGLDSYDNEETKARQLGLVR